LRRLGDGKLRRAPRQRDARAAVTVVVDDDFLVQLFAADNEAGRAERPQADNSPDNPFRRYAHSGQWNWSRRRHGVAAHRAARQP